MEAEVNIVMIARDRRQLTRQAIETLIYGADLGIYNLTIFDDGSTKPLDQPEDDDVGIIVVRCGRSRGIVGLARNAGIRFAEQYWGRARYLYLSDNDACFRPDWLKTLLEVYPKAKALGFAVLGGYTHPYHRPVSVTSGGDLGLVEIEEHEAIGGFSQLMEWETWERFGPLDAHAVGVCQSEDWAFCQKVRASGLRVGVVRPHVVWNCGLTSTFGAPAVGSEAMERHQGVLML